MQCLERQPISVPSSACSHETRTLGPGTESLSKPESAPTPNRILIWSKEVWGYVWEDGMTYGVQNSDDDGSDELLAGSIHPIWEEYAKIEAWKVSCEKYDDDVPSCGVCISQSAKGTLLFYRRRSS
jgi:hypothetical protein